MQLVGGEKNKGVQVVSEEKNENLEDKREPFWSVGREDRLHFSLRVGQQVFRGLRTNKCFANRGGKEWDLQI